MDPIPLSFLQIGAKTEREYYTQDGELLIAKGIFIAQQHLDTLLRRKIDTVFMKGENEDLELQKLLSADFKDLDALQIDETLSSDETVPNGLKDTEFAQLKPGREGLGQLLKSAKGVELDNKIRDGKSSDIPVGSALKERSKELTRQERTEEYKKVALDSYDESLHRTRQTLDALADGQNVSNESLRAIIGQFVNAFENDKNILLNLSSIKHENGDYLYHHSLNVCILSINIAAAFGYNEQQVIEIGLGALLHDVGMLLISKKIRFKEGRLAESEWFEIQKHPILGLHLLEKIDRLPESIPFIAYQTHERENGKGYPKQRSSRLIHNFAKIVAVADIFEALSSPRKYREGNIPYKAMENLIMMTRQGLISGEFVKSLLEYTSLFPVGSVVELSNRCLGKVIKANGNSFAKPVVSILTDTNGKKLGPQEIFEEDLSKNTSIQIVRAHQSTLTKGNIMLGF